MADVPLNLAEIEQRIAAVRENISAMSSLSESRRLE